MTLPQTTPIGTSLVHLLGAPVFHPAKATLAMTPQSTTELPCLLLPHHSKRILLQGPGGSGRTSMLMNLAYTSAAGATSTCHCLVQPCRCTPVVIYRKSQSMQKEDDFPIPCRCTNDSSTSTKGIDENSTKDWDLDILQRIRIRYVASAREILQDLLGMLGQPLHEQPFKAILIDDLDLICGDEKNENIIRPSSGTESSISIMQTLAVAVDTSHALQRLYGNVSIVVASVSLTAKVVAPWMETVVSLKPCSPSIARGIDVPKLQHSHFPGRRSSWRAEFRGNTALASSTVIDYTISNDSPDGPCIEWKISRAHGNKIID